MVEQPWCGLPLPSSGLVSWPNRCHIANGSGDPSTPDLGWVVQPDPRFAAAVSNGTAPSEFFTLRMKSRFACSGGCGPPAPTSLVAASCHLDAKNFSTTLPAVFELPVNLTDG